MDTACSGDQYGENACLYYNTPLTSRSSSCENAHSLLAENGLEGSEIQPFLGIRKMQQSIESQLKRLEKGASDQYLAFCPVTPKDLEDIDRQRRKIGSSTRTTHYTNESLLIIKLMPSAKHETAHLSLALAFTFQASRMGMAARDLISTGSTRYSAAGSSKEGGTGFKPRTRAGETHWPTIVFECGFIQSLRSLRASAAWWLINSGGDVKIVILISVNSVQSTIQIEKWDHVPPAVTRPSTRSNPTSTQHVATKVQVVIEPNAITGAPFLLEFQKLFLRSPAGPIEADFVFSAQELSAWAADIWDAVH